MIQSFADATTKDVFDAADTKAARRVPKAVWSVARRKLDALNNAASLRDLATTPGNRLEALKGSQKGRYSIRINDQYRLTLRFGDDGQAHDVRCEDYH